MPSEIEVPEALAAALAEDPLAREVFDGLAPSHRREYARWVAEAKKEETRSRRAARTIEMLRHGSTG